MNEVIFAQFILHFLCYRKILKEKIGEQPFQVMILRTFKVEMA